MIKRINGKDIWSEHKLGKLANCAMRKLEKEFPACKFEVLARKEVYAGQKRWVIVQK